MASCGMDLFKLAKTLAKVASLTTIPSDLQELLFAAAHQCADSSKLHKQSINVITALGQEVDKLKAASAQASSSPEPSSTPAIDVPALQQALLDAQEDKKKCEDQFSLLVEDLEEAEQQTAQLKQTVTQQHKEINQLRNLLVAQQAAAAAAANGGAKTFTSEHKASNPKVIITNKEVSSLSNCENCTTHCENCTTVQL